MYLLGKMDSICTFIREIRANFIKVGGNMY